MSEWVEIPAPADLVVDPAGNVADGLGVLLKIAGTSTDVTHASDTSGTGATTGGLVTRSDGTIGTVSGRRYIQSGQAVEITVNGAARLLQPVAASVESDIAVGGIVARKPSGTILQYVDPDGSDSNDGLSWGTAKATIAAAVTAMPVDGGSVILSAGEHVVSANVTWKSSVSMHGAGVAATIVRFTTTTGNVFDLTDASYCEFSDFHVRPTTQKTAGAIFFLDVSAGSCQRNSFRRLRVSNAFKNFALEDCTTTTFEDIQFLDLNASWGVHSLISLEGATTSTQVKKIVGGTAAAVTAALINITGGTVDTFHGSSWDLLNLSPSTGCPILQITAGQWIQLDKVSMEAGTTADAVTISGGRGIELNGHFLGRNGVVLSGGTGVKVNGHILHCEREAVVVGASVTHVDIDARMSELSKEATGTYPGVRVNAGASNLSIKGRIGDNCSGGTTKPNYCVDIASGAGNDITIDITPVGPTVAPVRNLATGTNVNLAVRDAPDLPQVIPASPALTLALTTSMAEVANTDMSWLKADFGPGNYQARAVAIFSGATAADSLEVQLFNVSFSNVPGAAVPVAAPNADPLRAVSAWYTLTSTRAFHRIRVRNATAARGNLKSCWYEVRRV